MYNLPKGLERGFRSKKLAELTDALPFKRSKDVDTTPEERTRTHG